MVHGVALASWCVLEYRYQMTALLISKVFSQEDSASEPLLSPSCDKEPPTLGPTEAMSSEDPRETKCDRRSGDSATALDPDAEFGGRETRKKWETRLLLKLDARMTILLIIYSLNYVSFTRPMGFRRVFGYSLHID